MYQWLASLIIVKQFFHLPCRLFDHGISSLLVVVRGEAVPSVCLQITATAYLGTTGLIFGKGLLGTFHGTAGGATIGITAHFVISTCLTHRPGDINGTSRATTSLFEMPRVTRTDHDRYAE